LVLATRLHLLSFASRHISVHPDETAGIIHRNCTHNNAFIASYRPTSDSSAKSPDFHVACTVHLGWGRSAAARLPTISEWREANETLRRLSERIHRSEREFSRFFSRSEAKRPRELGPLHAARRKGKSSYPMSVRQSSRIELLYRSRTHAGLAALHVNPTYHSNLTFKVFSFSLWE
jgi:hypothetical protein